MEGKIKLNHRFNDFGSRFERKTCCSLHRCSFLSHFNSRVSDWNLPIITKHSSAFVRKLCSGSQLDSSQRCCHHFPRGSSRMSPGELSAVCVCVSVYTVHHPLPQLDLTDALKMLCHASPGNVHHPRFIYMPGLDSSVCSPSRVSATPHSAVRFSPSFHPTIPFSGYLWEQRLEAAFPGNTNLPGFSLRDGAK